MSRPKRSKRSKKGAKSYTQFQVTKPERPTLETKLAVGVFPLFGRVKTETLDVLPIFRPGDYRVISKSNDYGFWFYEDYWKWGLEEPMQHYPTFQITVEEAIDRLETLGISMDAASVAFEHARDEAVSNLRLQIERSGGNAEAQDSNSPYKVLKNLSINAWQSTFSLLFKKCVWRVKDINALPRPEQELCRTFVLDNVNPYAFPCSDQRYFLRVALDVLPQDEVLILHCFLPLGFDGPTLYAEIENQLIGDSSRFDKTIVLIEGRTDSEILNKALRILRPHLAPMFHFMQFQEFGLDGGSSNLVNTARSFAASGIRNRVIVLFDNDTAGHEAANRLLEKKPNREKLPENFRVMTLPNIEEARNYRTIGPSGEQIMDVNERAAAIELYFPQEARMDENGRPYPVQWTGYIEKMKRYNGSIIHKKICEKRMHDILDRLDEGETELWSSDFSGFDAIFDALMKAFHKTS